MQFNDRDFRGLCYGNTPLRIVRGVPEIKDQMNFEEKLKQIDIVLQDLDRWMWTRKQAGANNLTLQDATGLIQEYRNNVDEYGKRQKQ